MLTDLQIWSKVRAANVKAKKHNNPYKITTREVRHLFNTWHCCLSCGDTHDLTLDHTVSLSQGGDNTLDNMQVLCHTCNTYKSTDVIDCRHGITLPVLPIKIKIKAQPKKVVKALYRDALGKTCWKCGEYKTTNNYYEDNSHSDGLSSRCRSCNTVMTREYRARKRGQL